MNFRLLLLPVAVFLGACQNMPEPYAPPEQRQPIEVSQPYRVSRVVNMDDGDADSHFVRDIMGLNGNWRWTGKRPAIRIPVKGTDKLHLVADLTVPDVTFKVTGPVQISFYVNDKLVGTHVYSSPGVQHVDHILTQDVVQPNTEAVVSAEIDKVWVSPNDGTQLGFILSRIGLKQED